MKFNNPYILNTGKMAMRFLFILCCLLLLPKEEVAATHIVGGNLTYRCLGNNLYEIRLSLRRDCLLGAGDAQFDDPASIGFFDATTNAPLAFVGFGGQIFMDFNEDDTLNQILVSDCSIAGNPVCVHQTTYVDTVFLPFWANGYQMVYQRCCRNGSVLNIQNPLLTGMTLVSQLSGTAQNVCKSSPQLGSYPPIYICVNKDIDYFLPATDSQGDSLVFSLDAPYSGGDIVNNMPQPPNPPPYDPVVWRPPYNLDNVMGGIPLNIDPVTGHITGRPNTIGQFVITIVIKSFRNGVELTQTRVDFQYNVRDCRDVPIPDFAVNELNCESLELTFNNLSVDADEYLWIFDFGNPNSATSTEENPTYTYPEDGFYDVALIVEDSNMLCIDTLIKRVGVFTSLLNADFSYSSTSCTDSIVLDVVDLSTDPEYPIVGWEWLLTYPGGVLVDTVQNPTFTFNADDPSTIFLVLIVTDTNGCTASEAKSFQVREIDLQLNPEADSICNGESVNLLLNGDCDLTYTWSPTLGLNLEDPCNPIAFPGVTVDPYYVTVTDGVCTLTDSITVNVQQLPTLCFTFETDCNDLQVDFTNCSTNGINYHWDFGDTSTDADTSILVSPSYTYNQPGIYIVTLSSRDGCDVILTDTVSANIVDDELDDQTINCFQSSIGLNPDANDDYNYIWSPEEFLDDPNAGNPLATVEDDTWFFVTITDPLIPECPFFDSILVIIPDDFDIVAVGDITNCTFEEVVLTATLTGNTNVEVVWKDIEGNVLGSGLELTVNPVNTTSYVIMATDTLGCMKSDTVTVLKPDPTFSVVTNADSSYCFIQTITLNVISVTGVTFEWFNANDELIGTGGSIQVTPGSMSCYYVIGTDPLGCQASDTVCLTPVNFDVSISGDESVCLGDPATIMVTDNAGQNLSYSWSPGGAITSSITVNPTELTTYTVTVTNDDLGCMDTLSHTVDVYSFNPAIAITADPDSLFLGQTSQLEVNQDPGYGYEWTASSGEILPPIYNPTVTPLVSTTYCVTVTDEHGCSGTACISVGIENIFCDERDIFVPNAFTPNSDGVNDIFRVRTNYELTDVEMNVYNRWGERVFSSQDINNGWDGTFNGQELSPDVFGFYLDVTCPNGEKYFKKGNVTLLH